MNKKSLVVTANSISEAFKRILENPKNKEAAREAIKNIIDRARYKIKSFNIEQLCILIKAEAHVMGSYGTKDFKISSLSDICNRESMRSA